jgi:large subunit ribosomal protein L13
MRQTTFITKKEQVDSAWHIVDADGQRLGRLAVQVATVLMGKHKPEYTAHVDTGDFVIIVNADKITLTGDKGAQRLKMRYSRYPGGLKVETYNQVLDRKPELLIEDAVRRMIPKGMLGKQMLKKLRIYKGTDHPHQAQQPQALAV